MWGGGKEVRSEKAAGMEGGLRAAAGCMASLQGRPPPFTGLLTESFQAGLWEVLGNQ